MNLLLSEHVGELRSAVHKACPAHAQVEEYVRAGKEGDFLKCLKIVKERIPLPMSIGRVCPRFCEKDCRKNIFGKAVSINDFKRLAADLHYTEYMEELPPAKPYKVAIVGGGPAGLSAAYYLARNGVKSTVFEQMPEAGGCSAMVFRNTVCPSAKFWMWNWITLRSLALNFNIIKRWARILIWKS